MDYSTDKGKPFPHLSDLRAGDKLLCVNDCGGAHTKGQVYDVTYDHGRLVVWGDYPSDGGYWSTLSTFTKVDKVDPAPAPKGLTLQHLKLAVGDTIRCVDDSGGAFTVGKEYTAFKDGFSGVVVTADTGSVLSFSSSKFVKVIPTTSTEPKVDLSILGDMVKTETIPASTKTTLVGKRDKSGPDFAYISVEPIGERLIDLVIGAEWKNKCASRFNKNSLKQLIDQLEAIHSLLKD